MPYRTVLKPYKPKLKTIRNVCRRIRDKGFVDQFTGKKHEPWSDEYREQGGCVYGDGRQYLEPPNVRGVYLDVDSAPFLQFFGAAAVGACDLVFDTTLLPPEGAKIKRKRGRPRKVRI